MRIGDWSSAVCSSDLVAAACYVARVYGVHSAMPMFKALKACPDAVVIRPDMAKYAAVGRAVRECMLARTPLVAPLSIDAAFLDLSEIGRATCRDMVWQDVEYGGAAGT